MSVVARSLPARTHVGQVGFGHVGDVALPALICAIFDSSTSKPVTSKPAAANSTASGSPT